MARRGQCRCGAVLKFRQRPWGYKTRCPHCGAIVRLRARGPTVPSPQPALPAAEEGIDVELLPLDGPDTAEAHPNWFWVGLTAVVSVLVLAALIWFLRR
jgi:hypothetical protein